MVRSAAIETYNIQSAHPDCISTKVFEVFNDLAFRFGRHAYRAEFGLSTPRIHISAISMRSGCGMSLSRNLSAGSLERPRRVAKEALKPAPAFRIASGMPLAHL